MPHHWLRKVLQVAQTPFPIFNASTDGVEWWETDDDYKGWADWEDA